VGEVAVGGCAGMGRRGTSEGEGMAAMRLEMEGRTADGSCIVGGDWAGVVFRGEGRTGLAAASGAAVPASVRVE
jgi:hypothetical protein